MHNQHSFGLHTPGPGHSFVKSGKIHTFNKLGLIKQFQSA
ncbi:hypothetical protein FLA_1131 [Filimonas lacunae]|nr:hypothetical protein FLA_1131 [Filimonas lacunae]